MNYSKRRCLEYLARQAGEFPTDVGVGGPSAHGPELFRRFTLSVPAGQLLGSLLVSVKGVITNFLGDFHGAFRSSFRVPGRVDVVVDGALLSRGEGVPAPRCPGRGPQWVIQRCTTFPLTGQELYVYNRTGTLCLWFEDQSASVF